MTGGEGAAVEGAVVGEAVGVAVVGASVGLLVDLPFFFFSVSFFAALAVVGLAESVGDALTVGWFVGLLVLDSFFFCARRTVVNMPDPAIAASCCASEVQANDDSHNASNAAESWSFILIMLFLVFCRYWQRWGGRGIERCWF